ncbi:MAG: hypothetical protein IMZ53_03880 [Thermoplasmata archaeon]|nr:hypothetical protein [Thermoplasmata archaeon]MBE3139706.1 hypothetical protein [Thermoplasmata archaeon]
MKRSLIVGIVFLFLSTVCLPVLADKNIYVQPDKVLTKEYFKYLFRGFLFIKDFKIKKVIIKIIFEIKRDGNATSEEIQGIIESSNSRIREVYILAEIKTTGNFQKSDGGVGCIPWRYAILNFHNATGIFAQYTPDCYKELYGWTLQIDGNSLSRNDGYILGYSGYINNYITGGEYVSFKLDGFGVLVLHEKNI